MLLSKMHFNFLKTYQGTLLFRPLFRYTRYMQSLSMFILIFTFPTFIVPEKSVMKIFKNSKIKNLSRNTTPRVMGLWPPFCHYIFLTLETKCGIKLIEVAPQVQVPSSRFYSRLPNRGYENYTYYIYSQTCLKQPCMGSLKCGC